MMACCLTSAAAQTHAAGPHIVLVIADDMGYGDLAVHGNRIIRTPNLDRLASQSAELTNFHVSPVCAPTRSALLTGRYNYRTGITDTFEGRAMMRPNEITLAQRLAPSGYRSGIFGKWHLGDCYPLRPIDHGFQEALVHRGGGIGQASDPPGGTSYFDPILFHNGREEKRHGYISDVITDAAIGFIEKNHQQPFFVYLAFNAPHVPLEVPENYSAKYNAADFSTDQKSVTGRIDRQTTSRVYGMITNIDENLGRLLAKLDELKLADDTIVLFLTDNGPQQPRYNDSLRGLKGTVYEGGIRVPLFVRYPKRIKPCPIDRLAAHIDIVPTLIEACELQRTETPRLDGISLWPLLTGKSSELPERTIFAQWHRGNVPERYRGCAAITQEWKLLRLDPGKPGLPVKDEQFELYHLSVDRAEKTNIAGQMPEVVRRLRQQYDAWFDDVCSAGFDPPRIVIGSTHENPTTLTRQDWRKAENGPAGGDPVWLVEFARPGKYRFTVRYKDAGQKPSRLLINDRSFDALPASPDQPASQKGAIIGPVSVEAGSAAIRAGRGSGDGVEPAYQIDVERIDS